MKARAGHWGPKKKRGKKLFHSTECSYVCMKHCQKLWKLCVPGYTLRLGKQTGQTRYLLLVLYSTDRTPVRVYGVRCSYSTVQSCWAEEHPAQTRINTHLPQSAISFITPALQPGYISEKYTVNKVVRVLGIEVFWIFFLYVC